MLYLRSDEATVNDLLDRSALVSRVGDLIATCDTPHVFGVHGDWGTGKTSFLQQVQHYISGTCPQNEIAANPLSAKYKKATVIWFEAWRYQHEAVPVVALLHEIRTQLPWTGRFRKEVTKIGEVAARSALLAMEDLTKKIGVQASKVQEQGEKWEQANLAVSLPSHVIRRHLEEAIETLLRREKGNNDPLKAPRLVVIVDDLDRCSPEAAYALLEGIKIYLNLRSCVFVLGMNQRIVEEAITLHLPKSQADSEPQARTLKAREYLEKLCQNIFHLPLVKDPSSLLDSMIEGVQERPRIIAIVKASRCLPANPRKIKAFGNMIRRSGESLDQRIAQEPKEEEKDRQVRLFLLVALLYQFHPDLFRLLEDQPLYYEEIRRWASGGGSDHGPLKYLQIRPLKSGAAGSADPGAGPVFGELYLDPGDPTYFRFQQLVADLQAVSPDELMKTIELL